MQVVLEPGVDAPRRWGSGGWCRRRGDGVHGRAWVVPITRGLGSAPSWAADAVDVDVQQRGGEAGGDGKDGSVLGEEDPHMRCAGGDGFKGLSGTCNGNATAGADRQHKDSAGAERFTNGGSERFVFGEVSSIGGGDEVGNKGREV